MPGTLRERRAETERRMLEGQPFPRVIESIVGMFGCRAMQVARDIRLIERRWDRESRDKVDSYRHRIIKLLDRNASDCLSTFDLAGQRDALFKIGKLLGMGAPAEGNTSYNIYAGPVQNNVTIALPDESALSRVAGILSDAREAGRLRAGLTTAALGSGDSD